MTLDEAREELKKEFETFKSGINPTDWKNPNEELKKIISANIIAIKVLGQDPVLDKIRAEIEQLPTTKCTETHRIHIDAYDFKKNVLMILDKYMSESEVKDE